MDRGPLRGRSEHMEHLLDVLRRTKRTGQGGVVVVSGEAGIGKTALLEAAAEQATRIGFAVGAGRADETARPAPLSALFRALRSGRSPLLTEDAFFDLVSWYDRELWLVDRLATSLDTRAGQSPMLIIVDDCHSADDLSVFALSILPGRLSGSPIVWLLAHNTTGQGIGRSATAGTPFTEIELGPLSSEAIEELAVDRLGHAPDQGLRNLLQCAEGNPFLAVELLAGMVAEPRPEPCSEQDSWLPERLVVGVRHALAPLSTQAVQLVRAGSVLGQSFAADDAAELLGGQVQQVVLPGLEPLVRAGVLSDDGKSLSFRHDLLRQAVYADIPPTARKAMHQTVARHIVRAGRSPVEAAAHVLVSAHPGDLEAVGVLRAAARMATPGLPMSPETTKTPAAATVVMSPEELIDSAFALLTSDDALWLEVGEEAVEMFVRARHPRQALAIADRLLTHVTANPVRARIESLLTLPLWSMGRIRELRRHAQDNLATGEPSDAGRARSLAQLALGSSRDEDRSSARTAATSALAVSRRSGDVVAQTAALWALGEIERNDGNLDASLEHFHCLRAMTGQTFAAEEMITLQLLDRYDSSAALITEARTDEHRRTPRVVVAFAGMWQAYGLGRLHDAETDALAVLHLAQEVGELGFLVESHLVLAGIAHLRGDAKAARRQLDLARAVPPTDDSTGPAMLSFAYACLTGTSSSAKSESRDSHPTTTPRQGRGTPNRADSAARDILQLQHRWRAAAGWVAPATRLALRDDDRAPLARIAEASATLAARNPTVPSIVGTAQQVEGLVADDIRILASAVATLEKSPRPLLLADALVDLGQALLRNGEREKGIAALDRARTLFLQAGAHGQMQHTQRILRLSGVRRRYAPPLRPTQGWDALTDAERRVAVLVAEGRTNKSVAAELLLSPNTVSTHLRTVFTKMHVSSRAQLARAVPLKNGEGHSGGAGP